MKMESEVIGNNKRRELAKRIPPPKKGQRGDVFYRNVNPTQEYWVQDTRKHQRYDELAWGLVLGHGGVTKKIKSKK
jgi:hypothetical protein